MAMRAVHYTPTRIGDTSSEIAPSTRAVTAFLERRGGSDSMTTVNRSAFELTMPQLRADPDEDRSA